MRKFFVALCNISLLMQIAVLKLLVGKADDETWRESFGNIFSDKDTPGDMRRVNHPGGLRLVEKRRTKKDAGH